MAIRPLRAIALPHPMAELTSQWLGPIEERLSDPSCDRNALCRDVLSELWFPGVRDLDSLLAEPGLAPGSRLTLMALDPRNVTLEPEYYAEVEVDRYAAVKPLLWLWQSFDRTLAAGGNVEQGVRLRRTLARHIFRHCGRNFKCFQYVEFSFGYNMEVGDDVVVHRHVLLDDRGGIVLGNRVSISDYANIYSHSHDIVNQADVSNARTVLEDGVRITYHATVLAGVTVGTNAMLGAGAMATRDLDPHWVHLGIPARPVRQKPNAPDRAPATGA